MSRWFRVDTIYSMTAYMLIELIDRLGNLLRTENRRVGAKYSLQPVHIQILDYLRRCNKYSNTPIGISKYLGITKGTMSQSLNILVQKGLILKVADSDDKRSVHLKLTSNGSCLLERIISESNLYGLLKSYSDNIPGTITEGLYDILIQLQKNNRSNTFGVCSSCRHLLREGSSKLRCGLTREILTKEDTELICHEHEYPDATNL